MMCALYGVTRSGFYAWQGRQPSERSSQDARLTERIRQLHQQSRDYYGSPRVASQLRREGEPIDRRRVARLMRCARLQGRNARRYHRSMVGQRGVVCEAIRNGEGKVRLGDGVWLAAGPDMAEGTPVVVDGVRGTKLHVNVLAPRKDAG